MGCEDSLSLSWGRRKPMTRRPVTENKVPRSMTKLLQCLDSFWTSRLKIIEKWGKGRQLYNSLPKLAKQDRKVNDCYCRWNSLVENSTTSEAAFCICVIIHERSKPFVIKARPEKHVWEVTRLWIGKKLVFLETSWWAGRVRKFPDNPIINTKNEMLYKLVKNIVPISQAPGNVHPN